MNDVERTTPEEGEAKASPYAWYVLGVFMLVYVLNFVDRQILSILATDIKRDLGLSDADMGFLYGTAFGVFYAVFGIPLGKLSDSWRRVNLLTVGLSLWSIMTALSGFSKNAMQLSVARIGVGVGEATANPSAYSLISDWFPKSQRATAFAIYASGLYIGGGLALLIGSQVVGRWNNAFPHGGPLGLVGWQAAFMIVGLPGLLLAALVSMMREPVRGSSDGILQAEKNPAPFKTFLDELCNTIPPFTLIGAARRGGGAVITNLGVAILLAILAAIMIIVTGNSHTSWMQWGAFFLGCYAVFSWGSALRANDPVAFKLIWGTPAFLAIVLGYGLISFVAYSVSFFAAPYAETVLHADKAELAIWLGAPGALGGFLGVILGGRVSDYLIKINPSGRLIVGLFGAIAPIIPFIIAFTTHSLSLFYALGFILQLLASTSLSACMAAISELVLPRMRGIATATFLIGTTLLGLSLGPYMAGYVSYVSGNMATGMLSLLAVLPISIAALFYAYRHFPAASASLIERARLAGEDI